MTEKPKITSPNRQPSAALVIGVVVVIVAAIAATSLLLITIDKSQLPEGWLIVYLGFLSSAVTGILAVIQGQQGRREQAQVRETVHDLANGRMDAKIRAAVADVLKDEHIDPAMRAQIEADRARRDAH